MTEPRYIVCVRDYFTGRKSCVSEISGFYAHDGFTFPDALAAIVELREASPHESIGSDYWLEPC